MTQNEIMLLCRLQGEAFELSREHVSSSSAIFIRRFMNSDICKELDNGQILSTSLSPLALLYEIENEYGESTYGSEKYEKDELYWMGYMYRYIAIICSINSTVAYKLIKPKELRSLFLGYHTLAIEIAAERLLEAKNLLYMIQSKEYEEEKLKKAYSIFKKYRSI